MNLTSPQVYSRFSRLLHWIMALLMIGMLTLGLLLDTIPKDLKFPAIMLHKSIGITLLALALIRLFWRFLSAQPAPSAFLTKAQETAASFAHYVLYVLMIAMPLSGWALSSSAGYPVGVFGLFNLPALSEKNHALHEAMEETHEIYGYLLIALITIHAVAALIHHFVKKDDILKRMLPCVQSPASNR